eukprot:s2317_g6.t1
MKECCFISTASLHLQKCEANSEQKHFQKLALRIKTMRKRTCFTFLDFSCRGETLGLPFYSRPKFGKHCETFDRLHVEPNRTDEDKERKTQKRC